MSMENPESCECAINSFNKVTFFLSLLQVACTQRSCVIALWSFYLQIRTWQRIKVQTPCKVYFAEPTLSCQIFTGLSEGRGLWLNKLFPKMGVKIVICHSMCMLVSLRRIAQKISFNIDKDKVMSDFIQIKNICKPVD